MVGFLTDDWLGALHDAAGRAVLPEDVDLVLQQVIRDDGGEVAYALVIRSGRGAVQAGRHPNPDITFSQDRATAVAIARGDLSAQVAFMAGDLRVGGDVGKIAERARPLSAIDDIFAEIRTQTTW